MLVQSLFVHAKVPPCMLLTKVIKMLHMKNGMKKHTCALGAIERGDARVRALQKAQDGRVQVHVSV